MAFRRWGIAVLLMAMLAVDAAAQKNELAGLIGRTFVSDQGVAATGTNVHFGKGLTFEVNYGRHLLGGGFAALTFEVPVVVNPDEDLNFIQNSVPRSYNSFFVTPSIRANIFAANAVSPWVSFGGGFGHFGESSDLLFFGSNTGKRGTTTGVFQIGAGLDVRFWKSLSARGEVRDFNSGVPQLNVNTGKSRQHNYFVSGGIVWHF